MAVGTGVGAAVGGGVAVGRGMTVGGNEVGSIGRIGNAVGVATGAAIDVGNGATVGGNTAVGGVVGAAAATTVDVAAPVGAVAGASCPPDWVQPAKAMRRAAEIKAAAVSFMLRWPVLSEYQLCCVQWA